MIRILLADDNPLEREIIREYLARYPQTCQVVAEAANGADAIRLAGIHDPDLALLDVRMPMVDGIEATRRLRAAGSRVKIITYTGFAGHGIREKALAAGAAEHFTKPFTLAVLYDTICGLAQPGAG